MAPRKKRTRKRKNASTRRNPRRTNKAPTRRSRRKLSAADQLQRSLSRGGKRTPRVVTSIKKDIEVISQAAGRLSHNVDALVHVLAKQSEKNTSLRQAEQIRRKVKRLAQSL